MIGLAAAVASATLAAGGLAALALRLLPTVRLQLASLALLSVALPLTAVFLSGLAMFHMGDDVEILAVTAAAASVAVGGALFLAGSITRRIEALRDTAGAFAAGDLKARASVDGPRELADLASSFNRTAAELDRLFDARRELVTWASHDLRTPIASIQAMLEALEDSLAEPERYLPVLQEQVRALSMLVDDLFELARIDAGVLTLELREAELASLVHETVRGLEAEASQRGIHLQTDVGRPARALCEPEKVQRVLFNLLTNALRHTPTDGSVAVRVVPRPAEVEVIVEDTGEGFDSEAEERMFERFWRGDRARSRSGAGLGLAIARGLVEAQGGRIWAENGAPGGRVSFTLPAP